MLEYSRHARERMRERGISEQEVEFCLDNYSISYKDKKGNSIYIAYLVSGKRVKVVAKAGSANPVIIITVAD